jgi:hypothetical protein
VALPAVNVALVADGTIVQKDFSVINPAKCEGYLSALVFQAGDLGSLSG